LWALLAGTGTVKNSATRTTISPEKLLEDTEIALRAALATLNQLRAQGHGGAWGKDRFNNPVGAATKQRYQRAEAQCHALREQLGRAGQALSRAIGRANGRRDGEPAMRAAAVQRETQAALARAEATVVEMRRAGVWRPATALFLQTEAQVAELQARLDSLRN